MPDHTPEPWDYYTHRVDWVSSMPGWMTNDLVIVRHEGEHVAYLDHDCRPMAEAEANARRIAACVNACRGIATEDLERIAESGFRLNPEAVEMWP